MRRLLAAVFLLLFIALDANSQPAPAPVTGEPLPPPVYAAPASPGAPTVIPPQGYGQPLVTYPEPVGEPPWCESPYRNSAWRIEFDIIPTVSQVSDQAFGNWDDGGGLALRLTLGYESCDGVGTRLVFWGFGEEADTPVGDVDLGASTFQWDIYKRFFVEDAEIVLGGGSTGGHLKYDIDTLNQSAEFRGGGISIFGEGFYPFWRFERIDVGSVVRARLSLLSGRWDDNGTPFINDTDHDVMTILDIGWGLEIRRRFGQHQDKYWYFDIVPEFQRWESSSLPDAFDPGFQGTNFSFGLAW
jgi:hypothetical protein